MKQVVWGFIRKEFAQTLRDPIMRVFIFVAPLIQLSVFGLAINTDFRNLNLAVIASPADAAARELSERIFATGWFNRIEARSAEPLAVLQNGSADAVLVVPVGGIDRAVARGNASLQLLVDAQNAVKARTLDAYIQSIAAQFVIDRYGAPAAGPVAFATRVLYNPALETSFFMIPGIMALIMCLVTIMLTSMSLAREKELGTFESIIASPLSVREILLGKTVPFIIIGLMDAAFIMTVGTLLFAVPFRGSFPLLVLAALIFVCATVSIGTLISTVARNQQQAMMGTLLFLFPAMLMSGLFFPIENMPLAIRWIAYIDPFTYFINLIRNLMLKGTIPARYWPNLGVLTLMTVTTVLIAARRFRQTLN
jgi:ABC-2 type transport system permease protein